MDKILVVTERFWPEEFLVNDFVRALRERGYAVEVLTQVPSYPFDKIYDGYENKHLQTTYWEGLPVHRVNTWFGYNKSANRKILNYLHFAWRTFWWAVLRGRRYDRVIVVHTAALTMSSSVYAMKLLWRRHIVIWTQDLWPDAVWGYGIRKTAMREQVLNCFVRSIYACCDRIAVSCPSYVGRIREICGPPHLERLCGGEAVWEERKRIHGSACRKIREFGRGELRGAGQAGRHRKGACRGQDPCARDRP